LKCNACSSSEEEKESFNDPQGTHDDSSFNATEEEKESFDDPQGTQDDSSFMPPRRRKSPSMTHREHRMIHPSMPPRNPP
jgi:hypothetical protein